MDQPAISVRPAVPPDYDAIRELTLAVYLGEGWADERYTASLADVEDRAAHAELLVADSDGSLSGAVALAWHSSTYAEVTRDPTEAAFRMLVVRPESRGRGIGRALVLACVSRARMAGAKRMVISTEPLMYAAHRLYDDLGFRRAPERDWSPHAGVDLLCYVLELT
ncbi:MAG: GNAT family N-acetyltransferase [Geodermatophilaceae bacterium]|nr:GNAT family N-acetyltransferase [Geodermatophilaceae bacterium]MDQ3454501.1 GNAT family N-acetyltransferase [Actinomycetota bacterium]